MRVRGYLNGAAMMRAPETEGAGAGGGEAGAAAGAGAAAKGGLVDFGAAAGEGGDPAAEANGGTNGAGGALELPSELFLDLPEGQAWDKLIPEPFRKDGRLDLRGLLKSHADTKTELRNRQTKAPEKYEVRVPEKLAAAGFDVPEDDPLWSGVTGWAKKRGLAQADLDELQGLYFEAAGAAVPDREAELTTLKAKFGDRTEATLTALAQWGGALVTDPAQRAALSRLAMTADGVLALDALRQASRERTLPGAGDGGGAAGRLTEADLKRLQASDEYLRGDADVLRRVEEGWAALSGKN